jgi:drug/metabolite transporter (DMT)-like permease
MIASPPVVNPAQGAEPPAGEAPASVRLPRVLRPADFLPMAVATLLWAWPTIFIRYIKQETGDQFTPDALNFYRYAAGSVFALAVVGWLQPADLLAVLRRPLVPLVLALILATFQVVWLRGVYYLDAAYSVLIGRASVVFALVLAYLVFADERRLIRSGRFLFSAALAMAAVAGISLVDPKFSLSPSAPRPEAGPTLLVGTIILLISAVIWGTYAVSVRKLASRLPAMATFAVTAAISTVLMLPVAILDGHMGFVWSGQCSSRAILAVVFSGFLCIGATQVLYYVSLKRIGVAPTTLVSLATPFLTGAFSYLVLGEKLSGAQWLLGAVLVASLAIMIYGSARERGAAGTGGAEPD